MGPVQLKDTSARVSAMKKMPIIPPNRDAFWSMRFTQRNLYIWETMAETAAWELAPHGDASPCAYVFEPPGRVGAHHANLFREELRERQFRHDGIVAQQGGAHALVDERGAPFQRTGR